MIISLLSLIDRHYYISISIRHHYHVIIRIYPFQHDERIDMFMNSILNEVLLIQLLIMIKFYQWRSIRIDLFLLLLLFWKEKQRARRKETKNCRLAFSSSSIIFSSSHITLIDEDAELSSRRCLLESDWMAIVITKSESWLD